MSKTKSILSDLVKEFRENREATKEFLHTLKQTVGPWEATPTGFIRTTIFGETVAVITRGQPVWRMAVEGEVLRDVAPVFHRTTSEPESKEIVDNLLKEKGYIVLD